VTNVVVYSVSSHFLHHISFQTALWSTILSNFSRHRNTPVPSVSIPPKALPPSKKSLRCKRYKLKS